MTLLDQVDEWGPERVICVSDRRTGMRGVLVIDNTARGIGKGGTRMAPTVTISEIARLARVMTWKWAGADLFFGGAKAGILGDPHAANKEEVLRAFARALSNEVPAHYVFGLDMGITEADAAIFQDELGDRGAAVGTPEALGGLPYDQLGITGFGVAEAVDEAASYADLKLASCRIAIQGFGAVGYGAAQRLHELGASVVAVSTARGAVHDPNGLDVLRLVDLRAEYGDDCVLEYGGTLLSAGSELQVPCEVLIPAATQDVIDAELASVLPAKVIVEGANLPTSPAAQAILARRGTVVVPDFVANAGGIVAAAFAMQARYSPFRPEPTQVLQSVSAKIRSNTAAVLHESLTRASTSHEAARGLAQQRVHEAMRLRGRLGQ